MKQKRSIIVLLALMLLGATSVVPYAAEEADSGTVQLAEANTDGFVIEDGVLWYYEGDDEVLVIPEGVTKIRDYAFGLCTNLKKITMSEGVKEIGEAAFENCVNLEEIYLPNTLELIGAEAFDECRSLTKITIPEGVTSIGENAFKGCENLSEIEIPSSVHTIGGWAFEDTLWLEEKLQEEQFVIVNEILVAVNDSISDCVVIPEGVTSISGMTFRRDDLTEVIIPEGVTSIGDEAFYWCEELEKITIPSTLTNIGDSVFGSTPWLEKQFETSPMLIINGILADADSGYSGDIVIPEGVTVIGEAAFKYCKVVNVYIPNTVVRIEKDAFIDCNTLGNVYIPSSVTYIDEYVFYDWSKEEGNANLKNVVLCAETGSYAQQYIYNMGELEAVSEDGKNRYSYTLPYMPTNKAGNKEPYVLIYRDSYDARDKEGFPLYPKRIVSSHMEDVAEINKTYPVEIRNADGIVMSIPVNGITNIAKYNFAGAAITDITEVDFKNLDIAPNEFVAALKWLEAEWNEKLPGKAEISIQLDKKWAGKTVYCYELDGSNEWVYQYVYRGKSGVVDGNGVLTVTDDTFPIYILSTKNPVKDEVLEDGLHFLENGTAAYYRDGKIATDMNGLICYNGQWYCLQNGVVDWTYSGLVSNENGWWYVENGMITFAYNGIASNAYGTWYIENSQVNFGANGVLNRGNGWYLFHGGQVNRITTVANNANGWWYIKDGEVDFTANTVANNANGWWYIENGQVDFGYNGIGTNANGSWYIENGQVNFGANGVLNRGNGWYLFHGGQVNRITTVANNANGWWYIKDGEVDFTANTVANNANGWWYIQNGQVDFTYNGLANNANGTWVIKNGQVDFGYNGIYTDSKGNTYTVVNGNAVPIMK